MHLLASDYLECFGIAVQYLFQRSGMISHPRHHAADIDKVPPGMVSLSAGLNNMSADFFQHVMFTGVMNMPVEHDALFIVVCPMERHGIMAHNDVSTGVGDLLVISDIVKITSCRLAELLRVVITSDQHFIACQLI